MFDYVLPVASFPKDSATKKPPPKAPPKKPDDKKGPVRTQMKGEKPGDDLGYDPKKIPVEDI